MKIQLYNTLSHSKEEFKPINKEEIRIYSCGPTVYSFAHIGNLRTYVFVDNLRRVLKYNGYNLKHVMNITDVGHLTSDADTGEDKMEKAARKEGKNPYEIAEYYTKYFMEDMKKLDIDMPNIISKATDNIPEMLEMVKEILKNGYAYETSKGIYFDVSKLDKYPVLSNNSVDGQEAGARIEVDYTFTVTNVGEVDYMDNQFYYTGVTNNEGSENIATTKAHTVVDYISNNIQFIPTSDANQGWSIRTVTDLTSNPDEENTNYTSGSDGDNNVGDNIDLINNKYYSTLNTYNNIVTTKDLSKGLYPDKYVLEDQTEEVSSYTQKTFRLSTTLTPDSGEETMVYNNLCEILQVSNSVGRRLKYSVTGNQPMADQEAGDDTPVDEEDEIYTKVDLVTPKEIDSDSSQEILILPPTGANRNYTLWIVVGVIALGIVAGGIFLIRRYFKNK